MRLVKVAREALTLTRQRRGRGFCYRDGEGALVSDAATRTRIAALAIPPAWQKVRIAPDPQAHIQALGIDEAGRDQYIYHPDWTKRRDRKKQRQLARLTAILPRLRRGIARDLRAETGSRMLALAIAAALIDKTAMRVGREEYLESSGTRGAGTLYARDVRVSGTEVCLEFDAKGGQRARYCVTDARLADAVKRIKTLPGRRLLVWRDEAGKVRPITATAINAYLRALSGIAMSAKDFRTLHASALAGEVLAQMEAASTATARRRQMAEVAQQVADLLRNTPAISRQSYIAPCLFRLFDAGRLQELWNAAGPGRKGLLQREKRLGAVLAAVG